MSKRKQEPRFLVTQTIAGKSDSVYTSQYFDEIDEDGVSLKVVPLNRIAFRLALKKMNMDTTSKKAGSRIGTIFKNQELKQAKLKKRTGKIRQKIKRALRQVGSVDYSLTNAELEGDVKLKYPKVYRRLQNLGKV